MSLHWKLSELPVLTPEFCRMISKAGRHDQYRSGTHKDPHELARLFRETTTFNRMYGDSCGKPRFRI
ncbi:hypothetical protein LIER_36925 [Lithospermum erythrorhizon]|uniref:Uncharacterized protein n=1 Tax=Lithospermum erythrorhizon TaxID=34254 RepID=A0AAV3PCE1_LITER